MLECNVLMFYYTVGDKDSDQIKVVSLSSNQLHIPSTKLNSVEKDTNSIIDIISQMNTKYDLSPVGDPKFVDIEYQKIGDSNVLNIFYCQYLPISRTNTNIDMVDITNFVNNSLIRKLLCSI